MGMSNKGRRLVHLIHRWTGIAGCILMLLWFISGVVMMYVGYPKLTPAERLGRLPPLPASEMSYTPAAMDATLTSLRGEPVYLSHTPGESTRVLSAATGRPYDAPISSAQALREAAAFVGVGATVTHAGMVQEDRWTHSRSLDRHRPLHRVSVRDPERTTLYVSSLTGQVQLDAPLSEQRWNYVGAWLHWLYAFRATSVDPTWTWLLIALSTLGTVTAVTGIVVGLWRWRFTGRYKSGSRSPYREPWMKWHHVAGLIFSAFVFTWIFSGLMSMNPLGVFSARDGKPDMAAYRAGAGAELAGAGAEGAHAGALAKDALLQPEAVIAALHDAGFVPVELSWKRLGGIPYALAQDQRSDTRIVRAGPHPDALSVEAHWDPATVLDAAQNLFTAPIAAHRVIEEHDVHYYQRHAAAMNGARQHGLPAVRVHFADPDDTVVYIDLPTGEPRLSLSGPQRASRWLFYFLHSWDAPALLNAGWLRDLAMILLSVGGGIVAGTGVVIGWRRLRRNGRG